MTKKFVFRLLAGETKNQGSSKVSFESLWKAYQELSESAQIDKETKQPFFQAKGQLKTALTQMEADNLLMVEGEFIISLS